MAEKYYLRIPIPGGETKDIRIDETRLTPSILNVIYMDVVDRGGISARSRAPGVEAIVKNVVDVTGVLEVFSDISDQTRQCLERQDNGALMVSLVLDDLLRMAEVFKLLGDAQPQAAQDILTEVMYALMGGLSKAAEHLRIAEDTAECHQAEARFFEGEAADANDVLERDAREFAEAAMNFIEIVTEFGTLEVELRSCAVQVRSEADERRRMLMESNVELQAIATACETFQGRYGAGEIDAQANASVETDVCDTFSQIDKAEQLLVSAQEAYRHVRTCAQSRARELEARFTIMFTQLKERRDAFKQWKERLDREEVNPQAIPTARGLMTEQAFNAALDQLTSGSWTPFRVNERMRTLITECHADHGKDLSLPARVVTAIKWARFRGEELRRRMGIKPKRTKVPERIVEVTAPVVTIQMPPSAPVRPDVIATPASPPPRIVDPSGVSATNKGGVVTIKAGLSRVQRARQIYEMMKCVGFVWTCSRNIRAIAQVRPMFTALVDLKLVTGRDTSLRADVERLILGKSEHRLIYRNEEATVQQVLQNADYPWIGLTFPEYGGLTYKLTDFGAQQARETIQSLSLDIGAIDRLRPPSRFKDTRNK